MKTICRWLAIVTVIGVITPKLSAETTHCPGNVASVPLRHLNRYQMIVEVSLNHSGSYDFLLDTGTQITTLDRSLAADLRLDNYETIRISGVGFRDSASPANIEELAVGTHAVSHQKVLIYNLAGLRSQLHIVGILGEDFLQHFDMLIDNAHRTLCLDEEGSLRMGMKGQHIPLLSPSETAKDGWPAQLPMVQLPIMTVRFFMGMRPARLMLDSGSDTPFLYGPSDYLNLAENEGSSWRGMGVDGKQHELIGLPPQDMKINGFGMSGVLFLALRNKREGLHADSCDGLLPTGVFKRVFISRGGDFAVLEPSF